MNPINVDDEKLKDLTYSLDIIMRECLYGGAGDPGWDSLVGAAACFNTLKFLNVKIKNEKDIRTTLEHENVYEKDFIKGFYSEMFIRGLSE
jgi:hypothetical protein